MLINVALLSCVLGSCFAQQAPVPDVEKLKEAEKLMREIFKTEFAAKTAADRGGLARKLLGQAQGTSDDPATLYVLLRESRELAIAAGDLATSFKAIDLMGLAFAVDTLTLKAGACLAASKSVRTPEEIKALVGTYLDLANEASGRDQYDVARQAAESAGVLARRLKDLQLITRADSKAREAIDRREQYAKIKQAQETLASSPDDPEANLQVGEFECWLKGDWDRGLRRLAKGADPALKALAEEDLAAPSEVAAQVKLGDGWWELAEKVDASQKSNLQNRARHWYQQAISGAQGLTKVKLEGRLKGIWIPLFDGRTIAFIKESSQPSWEVVNGVLCKRSDMNVGLQTRQLFQDGEFRIRFENKGLKQMTFSVRQGINGKDALVFAPPQITGLEGKAHEVLFQCRGPEVKAFLDGQPMVLYSRGPVAEGHIQIWGDGPTLRIFSLEYRLAK